MILLDDAVTISCWENDVTAGTITNCWARSQCIDFGSNPQIPNHILLANRWAAMEQDLKDFEWRLNALKERGVVESVPRNVQDFIDPPYEQVVDPTDDLIDQIVDSFMPDENPEDDEPLVTPDNPVSHVEALHALHEIATI